jgi:sodium/proline symporter
MVILVPVAGLIHVGGIHAVLDSLHAQHVSLALFKTPRDLISALLLAAGWGLGYFGQPHVLFNFMGIDDPKKISYAKYVGMSWMFIALTAATCVGLVGVAFFATVPLASPEFVFVTMAKTLFHPFIAGLVLCAILAATFSTMDAQIFISGTTFAEDICRVFVPNISSHQLVSLSRIAAIAVSAVALFFAWDTQATVYDLVNYAWAGLGSALGPVTITSLYTRKLTPEGALASIFAGGCTSALWPYFNTSIMPLIPGFAVGLAALFLVSYITKK